LVEVEEVVVLWSLADLQMAHLSILLEYRPLVLSKHSSLVMSSAKQLDSTFPCL